MRPDLKFFRELRVSDPLVAPDATTSIYTFVDHAGKRTDIELRWKFPVPLYANADDVMRNHARLHHAIPSLNYGLFCERVVLEFPLEPSDVAYLRQMQGITAREQYLTRFVTDEPHPLILPEFHVKPEDFEPEAVDDLAEIVVEERRVEGPPRVVDPERFAVLSSGGKESLLTYGLLRELGRDVSPVYVNESGRHWHTALLAHRLHERTDPRTRRIWSSIDRLYVAANKLLPCVRQDWQRLEADVYPIQLFTFNSYQIAVAGLCLHEGIGTMLMGNEFDEGPWPEVKGVRHWWGIYDQSQEFDLVLNAYFAEKKWGGLTQTSLLRTLSSLLIEDLLATRYPDLLTVQTSCHATHMEDGAPAPCGRCSKCQGVILLLLAGGHDPAKLRYAKEDVDALAHRIAESEIKVDQVEAEHAMWMAQQRGWRFEGSGNGYAPREHPQVQSVRFHPEMSRRDAMPPSLVAQVYPIFLTRAKGVLEKRGEAWESTGFSGDEIA
ncbi:MAG: hypothetical protein QOE90_1805 [Thermoplasmata archaeon]|jgi:hypothetical protein|nr:hypothetical protein [Thermoplasmata archaeon]